MTPFLVLVLVLSALMVTAMNVDLVIKRRRAAREFPTATGAALDALAANIGLQRKVETDASLRGRMAYALKNPFRRPPTDE